jgi:hypothetical protein
MMLAAWVGDHGVFDTKVLTTSSEGRMDHGTMTSTSSLATQKARLITETLNLLRAAHAIDERDSLTVDEWVSWYDATIPTVTEIKVLAAAMERELEVRRGEAVVQNDERRGGDPESNVTQCVTRTRMERSRNRQLGRAAPQVRAWIAREASAGRAPTRRGALTVAGIALKQTPSATPRPTSNAERLRQRRAKLRERREHMVTARKNIVETTKASILAAVETLAADGTFLTDNEIRYRSKIKATDLIRYTRLIDWLTIERTGTGTRFTIDHNLRACIEVWKTRPSLPTVTVAATLPVVLAELRRRRKENHDRREQTRWSVTEINKLLQREYLNWVETELARLVDLLTPMPVSSTPVASPTPPSAKDGTKETSDDYCENGRHGKAADAGNPE